MICRPSSSAADFGRLARVELISSALFEGAVSRVAFPPSPKWGVPASDDFRDETAGEVGGMVAAWSELLGGDQRLL
jgi:hypothetical protein